MRRPRFTVRRMMVATAVVAALLGRAAGVRRRGESFRHRAEYHLWADGHLTDEAGGPLGCSTGLEEGDIERIFCGRGPRECRAFHAAEYHYALSEKYLKAAERPWLPVAEDPPPPPGAYPSFKADARYTEIVEGEVSGSGFK
jgi:hypothetical protein